jgi:hypothetical protein
MAVKSTITAKITARADGNKNPVSTERELWTDLTNEIFGANQKHDDQSTTEVLTLVLSGALYSLTFTKIGVLVHVFGYIRKNSADIPSSTVIANITNPEFQPQSNKQFRINGYFDGSNNIVPFVFENSGINNRIRNFKLVPATEEYYLNGFYVTNPG